MTKASFFSLIAMAIFCLPIIALANNKPCTASHEDHQCAEFFLVKKMHPGAQAWFDHMTQKYPQAHLDKIMFCVGDNYESGPGTIYFPLDRIQRMDQVFNESSEQQIFKYLQSYPENEIFKEFAQDEYLLLHEAKHVSSKDYEKGIIASIAATTITATLCAFFATTSALGKIQTTTGIASSMLATATIFTTLWSYARYQESQADDFANKHADIQALLGGLGWFLQLDANDEIKEHSELNIKDILHDPVHAYSKNRAARAWKALWQRIEEDSKISHKTE